MCGRYVFALRPSEARRRLEEQNMPSDDAPADDNEQIRQSYNFAPGYFGLIYRAATNDRGTDTTPLDHSEPDGEPSPKKAKLSHSPSTERRTNGEATKETRYKLQAAKWGLIPFWTKRSPDYGSMLRTINCRDDSLLENRGMWTTMKQRKRCIVLAEGFYEWLKKNNGKERIPHYIKRKDGRLMCFAGLWDCVQYENSDDKLYTYTVITTDSNAQLKFLHDRMPVILEPGSAAMMRWLDPTSVGWDKELQGMLKPFAGELDIYAVDKAVGKVGNNSPRFVVPLDSKENKSNIANFFGNSQQQGVAKSENVKKEEQENDDETETTVKLEDPESNAPLPKPKDTSDAQLSQAIKQESDLLDDDTLISAADDAISKGIDRETEEVTDTDLLEAEKSPPRVSRTSPRKSASAGTNGKPSNAKDDGLPEAKTSSSKKTAHSPTKSVTTPSKTRSATSNASTARTPTKAKDEGNLKITAFFAGK